MPLSRHHQFVEWQLCARSGQSQIEYSDVFFSSEADIAPQTSHVRKVRILLQKSFWGSERKFLERLMRFTRGDVRDYIVSSKIDHGPPEWR